MHITYPHVLTVPSPLLLATPALSHLHRRIQNLGPAVQALNISTIFKVLGCKFKEDGGST